MRRPAGGAQPDGPVVIVGAGRLGRTLAAALRQRGVPVRLVGWRASRRGRALTGRAATVVVATRDDDVELAALRATESLRPRVVLHCAGALGPERLAAARRLGTAVGQLHPLVAVASHRCPPDLSGAWAHVAGDRRAVAEARRLCALLGVRPFHVPGLHGGLYHAAAVLLAGGTVALVDAAEGMLAAAGVPRRQATRILGPLLESVTGNVRGLGLPRALTGPARRGERQAVEQQCSLVGRHVPELLPLARALFARELGLAGALPSRERRRAPGAATP